jgi:prephenate dehydrogenase
MTTPRRLAILGVGLLGGSLGLAWKSSVSSGTVVGYGHRRSTLDQALRIEAIDEAYETPEQAVQQADIIVLCTPVGIFEDLLRRIAPALPAGAVVTDVGSTKRSVVRLSGQILPPSARFVGSHPMAGSERRGVEFARPDLFHNALCITTPTESTDPQALQTVEQFWRTIGMRITRLSPEAHDQLLADVSHLPHVVAAAVVAMQKDEGLPLSGKGFIDATRIAGGDGGLWRDILLDNRDNLRSALQRLRENLDQFDRLLEPAHAEELRQWLDAAAQRREKLLQQKLRELSD